jgi:hypothetical protein
LFYQQVYLDLIAALMVQVSNKNEVMAQIEAMGIAN